MTISKFVLVNEADNVLICCRAVEAGENILVAGQYYETPVHIEVGHKIARQHIQKGDKIIRYGVSIGSAIDDIKTGEHIHLQNLKSDYIPSHTRKK